jgi:translation initiation factor 2 subunit 3
VTNVRDTKIEVKLKKPVCLMPKSRVAISRRIAERWRLIGSGIAV